MIFFKSLNRVMWVAGFVLATAAVHAETEFSFVPAFEGIVDPDAQETEFPEIEFTLNKEEKPLMEVIEDLDLVQEETPEALEDEALALMEDAVDEYNDAIEIQEHMEDLVRHAESDAFEDEDLREAVLDQWDENVANLLRRARVALKTSDFKAAEGYYIEALNYSMDDETRIQILFEMADQFHAKEIYSKESAILEKFIDIYPHHPKVSKTLMRLGYLYRDIGAEEVAIERFFQILNMSLAVNPKEYESFKKLAQQAQIEIAHTYFLMGDYERATSHYNRLNLAQMSPEEQKIIMFRAGYSAYQMENYLGVLERLELFLQKFGQSDFAPEAHFILANTYKHLDRTDDAVREVRKLLREELKNMPKSQEIWAYWQKRTANKIANEFYEQGDFMNALKIYQTMVPVNRSPEWQWPIIYQIGLCFEQLGMYPKAHQAYTVIMNSTEWAIDIENLSEALASIKEMAAWRQDHLKWVINSEFQLRKLIRPTTADIIAL